MFLVSTKLATNNKLLFSLCVKRPQGKKILHILIVILKYTKVFTITLIIRIIYSYQSIYIVALLYPVYLLIFKLFLTIYNCYQAGFFFSVLFLQQWKQN